MLAKETDESKLELSNETIKAIEEAREDIKKGRIYTSKKIARKFNIERPIKTNKKVIGLNNKH